MVGRIAFALVIASGAASAQGSKLTAEFQAGVDAYRLGKYDDAKKHLEAARDLDPKLPGPHRFLAAVAQARGKWDDCIVEAGCYITAGSKLTLPDGQVVKARELSGVNNLLFWRNSVTGALEARPRKGSGIELNAVLHANA